MGVPGKEVPNASPNNWEEKEGEGFLMKELDPGLIQSCFSPPGPGPAAASCSLPVKREPETSVLSSSC